MGRFPSAPLARTILNGQVFNWALVDAEHGQITDKDYHEVSRRWAVSSLEKSWLRAKKTPAEPQLCNAIAQSGASPIIRVPWDAEWLIKRALDSGAHGVMTPLCHTAVSLPVFSSPPVSSHLPPLPLRM